MDTAELRKQIIAVVEEYDRVHSVKGVAKNMNMTTSRVRKMLITANVWSNKTSQTIIAARREHNEWSTKQIAEHLNVSEQLVQMYLPYKECADMGKQKVNTNETSSVIVDEGECGNKVVWRLTNTGKLTLSGTGPMWDYTGPSWGRFVGPRPVWWFRRDGIEVKKIEVEEGITTIGEYAFSYLIDLEEVTLPKSIEKIGLGAFAGENYLKRIIIPEKVKVISYDMFYTCVWLEEIQIPASVIEIQDYAFHSCLSLRRIYFGGDCPRIMPFAFERCRLEAATIYHKAGAVGFENGLGNGYRTEVF